MKTLLVGVTIVAIALCGMPGFVRGADDDPAKGDNVVYQVHSGHFESNMSGLKGDVSYLAITDRATFDKLFGSAFVVGAKNDFVPKDAFDTKMVAAVIKRGNMVWDYKVEKVTADKDTLYVKYNATSTDGGSATFASPLIVTVDKGKYSAVEFHRERQESRNGMA